MPLELVDRSKNPDAGDDRAPLSAGLTVARDNLLRIAKQRNAVVGLLLDPGDELIVVVSDPDRNSNGGKDYGLGGQRYMFLNIHPNAGQPLVPPWRITANVMLYGPGSVAIADAVFLKNADAWLAAWANRTALSVALSTQFACDREAVVRAAANHQRWVEQAKDIPPLLQRMANALVGLRRLVTQKHSFEDGSIFESMEPLTPDILKQFSAMCEIGAAAALAFVPGSARTTREQLKKLPVHDKKLQNGWDRSEPAYTRAVEALLEILPDQNERCLGMPWPTASNGSSLGWRCAAPLLEIGTLEAMPTAPEEPDDEEFIL